MKAARAELSARHVECFLDGEEPLPAAAEPLGSGRWDLVTMDTGHRPTSSRPREPARFPHEAVTGR